MMFKMKKRNRSQAQIDSGALYRVSKLNTAHCTVGIGVSNVGKK
jgi:hypothetical protein